MSDPTNYSPFFGCEMPPEYHVSIDIDASKRTIVIGDIHGCLEELKRLLAELDYDPQNDIVFLIGDLVNKGPNSIGVVEYAMENNFYAIRGNNEDRILGYLTRSRMEPSYVFTKESRYLLDLSEKQVTWLKNLPYTMTIKSERYPDVVLVHAGLMPTVPIEEQCPYLMVKMRGIIDGKTQIGTDHKDAKPWVDFWEGPELVIFGHDSERGLQKTEHAIGLDTGCVYGGKLSAIVLETMEIISIQSNFNCDHHNQIRHKSMSHLHRHKNNRERNQYGRNLSLGGYDNHRDNIFKEKNTKIRNMINETKICVDDSKKWITI